MEYKILFHEVMESNVLLFVINDLYIVYSQKILCNRTGCINFDNKMCLKEVQIFSK